MTKPDDIPKDVRAAADALSTRVYLAFHDDDGRMLDGDPTDILARALMSAKAEGRAEEREACAKIADDREAICADAVAKIEAGELYQGIPTAAATESCARLEAAHIARLIRNRP